MSIGIKTRKMLWGRAANRCAHPECKLELVMNETETDDESIIGDEAHIVAQKQNGARGDSNFPIEKIDKCGNLILLCKIHHKLVDDQFNTFSVEVLQDMKIEHENWVKEKLDYNDQKQKDDAVNAIELRIQESKGVTKDEKPEEIAKRLKRKIKYGEESKALINSLEGLISARKEIKNLFSIIENIAKTSSDADNNFVINCKKNGSATYFNFYAKDYSVILWWKEKYTNSLSGSYLSFELLKPMRSPHPSISCTNEKFTFSINEVGNCGFNDGDGNFYNSENLAKYMYKLFFERIEKELNIK